jgi:PilZ domain
MEERREPRYPTRTTATLRVLSDADLSVCVTVIDISRSGLRAECPQFLRHGSEVSIETKELTVVGTVKNCTEIRSGLFGVGIGIGDVAPHRITPLNSK